MKIAVLVSGGVDSSVALRLLKDQGHELTAFYLKIWLEDELSFLGQCPWEEDLAYVQQVCDQAGVPLKVISLQKEYHEQVVSYAIAEVKAGRTPNPDMLCNVRIKFGLFLDHIDDSYEKVATGHYAQVTEKGGGAALLRSPDPIKDQSYFLSHLSPAQLKRALFPIGHLTKAQVRELACEYDLPNKDRKDSQGICFLGKVRFKDFIKEYLGEQKGDMIEYETDKKRGEHQGAWFHTIGQRQGLGLAGGPWYVVAKDMAANRVYISRNYYSPEKKRDSFAIESCNWFINQPIDGGAYQVKLRHGPHLYDCVVTGLDAGTFSITLAERDQGIAPGQFAVLYQGQECLGGGVITQGNV